MSDNDPIRTQLAKSIAWDEAHAGFDAAVADLAPELRGRRPNGFPHSAWELLEHIRLGQADILEFCRSRSYKEKEWPADYWPNRPEPLSAAAWSESIGQFHRDRGAFQEMIDDPDIDLTARVPHGTGQTYLREILIVIDHTSYHVGQLIAVRRLLGAWPED
jgi:uncharacterized damage-inducible protein DinB